MLELSKEIKEKIACPSNLTIDINGTKYYIKKAKDEVDGIELVIEELAKLVNIKCAHYERVKVDNNIYYLSEDLGKDKPFSNKLNDIFNALEATYPNQIVFLIDEIVKIFIFDSLIINYDRSYYNWGFNYDKNGISDVVIYDNEFSFTSLSKGEMHFTDEHLNNIYELVEFLKASPHFIEMFNEMYNILKPEVIFETFNKIQRENNIIFEKKEIFVRNYLKNYILIGEQMRGKTLL